MEQQVAWAAGKPGEQELILLAQSDTKAYHGQLEKARVFSRGAVELAVRSRRKETAGVWQAEAALREAEFGNAAEARQNAAATLALASTTDLKTLAALALARAGDAAHAEALEGELAKANPSNTLLNSYWLPAIRGAIEIRRSNPAKAVELLRGAGPYELGRPRPLQLGTLYPVYIRGEAYLLSHQGKEAAAEFQKIIDHRGIVLNSPIGALAHLGLARAYVLRGDTAKARAAYQDFLTLWKDAEPDIPILKQAKAEYVKL
jgi:eukaryotic-like serine/threonine-protein kinase